MPTDKYQWWIEIVYKDGAIRYDVFEDADHEKAWDKFLTYKIANGELHPDRQRILVVHEPVRKLINA